ncbi:hypothetical protein AB833_05585 [Chromatiales bacterium (ex Bugula neritina AB1)]|nr:hypothetical protein AB833_05585 [Chromatiales bacterium (ex Bugula neritina AB1)]
MIAKGNIVSNNNSDSLLVRDRLSRRRFIRSGSAFLLAGSAAIATSAVRADDCDRMSKEELAKTCYDNDSGDNTDPKAGCIPCSALQLPLTENTNKPVKVAKVIA